MMFNFNLLKKKWKANEKIKRPMWKNRNTDLILLSVVFIVICISFIFLMFLQNNMLGKNKTTSEELLLNIFIETLVMLASAIISAIVTIYMVKRDIIENELMDKIQNYGIITLEDSYDRVFTNEDAKIHLKAENWNDFWVKSENKYICISGISLEGFFLNGLIRRQLLELCLEYNYEIDIILGNPFSEEVVIQAIGEDKVHSTDLRRRILNTYSLLEKDKEQIIEEYEKNGYDNKWHGSSRDIFKEKFHIRFSYIMPKALVVQSGYKMIVSSYLLSGTSRQPTLILKDSGDNSFYVYYSKYLQRIKELSCEFDELLSETSTGIIRNRYGIANIIKGRNHLFNEDFEKIFGVKSWQMLFNRAKEIDVIGISMYGFFTPEGLQRTLIKKAADRKRVTIIWANPFSEETRAQSIIENKEGKIEEHILLLRDMFNDMFNDLDTEKQKSVKENLKLLYSETLPKAWIVRVDKLIIYTPYFLSGPYEEPVFVLPQNQDESNELYNRLVSYIMLLKNHSKTYGQLTKPEINTEQENNRNQDYKLDN